MSLIEKAPRMVRLAAVALLTIALTTALIGGVSGCATLATDTRPESTHTPVAGMPKPPPVPVAGMPKPSNIPAIGTSKPTHVPVVGTSKPTHIPVVGTPKPTHIPVVGTPKPTIAARTPGDVVSANTSLRKGQLAYKLADGSFVVVDKSQPLPDAVQSVILTEIQTIQTKWDRAFSGTESGNLGVALGRVRLRENAATGKRIVMIFFTKNDAPRPGGYWNIGPMPANIDLRTQQSWTRASAIGYAREFVAIQKNSEIFSIIISG